MQLTAAAQLRIALGLGVGIALELRVERRAWVEHRLCWASLAELENLKF